MKIIDEKGKLAGIINLADLLIIIGLLAAIAFGFLYFNSSSEGEIADVVFTVEFAEVGPELAQMINYGDEIKDSVKGFYLGVVEEYSVEPATRLIYNTQSDSFIHAPVPGKERVLIRIRGKGHKTDSNVYTEGQSIKVGQLMYIRGKGYASQGYVIDLFLEKGGE